MSAISETLIAERQILIVGPYGVLGTGVVDAIAKNPKWGITTAARRPAPTYRTQAHTDYPFYEQQSESVTTAVH